MYCPPSFDESRPLVIQQFVSQYPLATIVSVADGCMSADHLPLVYHPQEGALGKFIGHVARNNSVWQVHPQHELLLIFHGPQFYVTPNWYPTKKTSGKVVPTWNYVAVHVHATLVAKQDRESILAILEEMTTLHEAGQSKPWRVADAPNDFTERLTGNIVGIELDVKRIQGKWKVSQNQSAENRQGVVSGLQALGTDASAEMAELVRRFGPAPEA